MDPAGWEQPLQWAQTIRKSEVRERCRLAQVRTGQAQVQAQVQAQAQALAVRLWQLECTGQVPPSSVCSHRMYPWVSTTKRGGTKHAMLQCRCNQLFSLSLFINCIGVTSDVHCRSCMLAPATALAGFSWHSHCKTSIRTDLNNLITDSRVLYVYCWQMVGSASWCCCWW